MNWLRQLFCLHYWIVGRHVLCFTPYRDRVIQQCMFCGYVKRVIGSKCLTTRR